MNKTHFVPWTPPARGAAPVGMTKREFMQQYVLNRAAIEAESAWDRIEAACK